MLLKESLSRGLVLKLSQSDQYFEPKVMLMLISKISSKLNKARLENLSMKKDLQSKNLF